VIEKKYSEIIKENKKLEKTDTADSYEIAIISNIMVHQSKEICEFSLREEGINANVILGDYDNIIQDSKKFQNTDAVVVFWELYNFIDGLHYIIETLSDKEFKEIINKVQNEIDLLLHNLQHTPLVLINKFSALIFNKYSLVNNRMNILADELNEYLKSKNNIKLIDIDKIISMNSIDNSIDLRYYYSSKTMYSIDFYKEYMNYIKPIFLSANGKIKKALIFDCDNTLWKGILGEDGFSNIKIFKEIQYLALELSRKGIIIGLCSKNNSKDVDEVLENHKEMILRNDNIVIKKVNWNDKVSNLKEIAKELNIGIDSLVFIDDSNFEVNLVRENLPMIEVFQVPVSEYEYGLLIRRISNLFYNPIQTKEDLAKVKIYKAQVQRNHAKKEIGNIEDYLKSLGLIITVYIDDSDFTTRVAQMTQKTNQFNLTTKRYTEKEIEKFIYNESKAVVAIGVKDKYGDNGIVGLCILDYDKDKTIDTFLMSCRVLGRNIEYKFMDVIIDILKLRRINTIRAKYIKTLKNEQVSDLYDKYGFSLINKDDFCIEYKLDVNDYEYKQINYIKVEYGK